MDDDRADAVERALDAKRVGLRDDPRVEPVGLQLPGYEGQAGRLCPWQCHALFDLLREATKDGPARRNFDALVDSEYGMTPRMLRAGSDGAYNLTHEKFWIREARRLLLALGMAAKPPKRVLALVRLYREADRLREVHDIAGRSGGDMTKFARALESAAPPVGAGRDTRALEAEVEADDGEADEGALVLDTLKPGVADELGGLAGYRKHWCSSCSVWFMSRSKTTTIGARHYCGGMHASGRFWQHTYCHYGKGCPGGDACKDTRKEKRKRGQRDGGLEHFCGACGKTFPSAQKTTYEGARHSCPARGGQSTNCNYGKGCPGGDACRRGAGHPFACGRGCGRTFQRACAAIDHAKTCPGRG